MSTIYNRSLVMLDHSKYALGKISIDDAYLDVACFEAQQALEFLMKAILIENGVAYDKSHSIGYLLDLIDNNTDFTFEKHDSLELLSDTITNWEENSRYGKGVKTGIQTVQRVHNIYKNMNESFLKNQENNQENNQEKLSDCLQDKDLKDNTNTKSQKNAALIFQKYNKSR